MKIKEKLNILLRKQEQINNVFQHTKPGNKAYSRFPEIKLKNTRAFNKLNTILRCYRNQISKKNSYSAIELYIIMINKKINKTAYHYFEKHHSLEKLTFVETKRLSKAQIQKRGSIPQFLLILSARPKPSSDAELTYIRHYSTALIKQAKKEKLMGNSVDFKRKDISELFELNEMRESIVQVLAFY